MDKMFKKRHSVRNFQAKEIEPEKLKEVLEVIDSAPSAGNLKAREVVVVEDKKTKKELAKVAFGQDFVAEAPVVLIFFAVPSRSAKKYGERGKGLYALQDATIAASFAWLQATILDLGAAWVGAFEENEVNRILKIKGDWLPVAIMPLGYPK